MIRKIICAAAMMLWASSVWALDADALKNADIPADGTKAQKEVCAAAMSAAYFSFVQNPNPDLSEQELAQIETYAFSWTSYAAVANGMDMETYFEQRLKGDIVQLQALGAERWAAYAAQCFERSAQVAP
ncbi:MAG: hypothetical protein AAGC58_04310 [Asticcacaulis sp.]